MDGGAWWAAVHGVARSRSRLSDFTFTFHFHALGREMAAHSSVLAWRIPGTGEPGGLPSLGSHRVGHDWSDAAAACTISFDLKIAPQAQYLFFFLFRSVFSDQKKKKKEFFLRYNWHLILCRFKVYNVMMDISLGRQDPLEKEMTTHSGMLAWRVPWTEKPGGL